MADVTVSQLTRGLPPSNDFIPFSNGTSTLAVAPSGLLVNAGKVGINTSNPRAELTFSRTLQLSAESIELNVQSGIGNGYFDVIKFTQGSSGNVNLASIRCNYFSTGQTALVFSTRESETMGTTLNTDPMLILDRNNGNVLNHGLILSGGYYANGMNDNSANVNTGIQSLNIARFLVHNISYNPAYVHIITPFDRSSSNMFFLELKGYALHGAPNTNNGTLINVIFAGYQSTVSNADLQRVSTWDAMNAFQPTVYYSTNYNRTVCRLYFPVGYNASFTVNSVTPSIGRVLKPGDLQIISSPNATI